MPEAGIFGALVGLCPLKASEFFPVRAVQSLNKEVPMSLAFPQHVAHLWLFSVVPPYVRHWFSGCRMSSLWLVIPIIKYTCFDALKLSFWELMSFNKIAEKAYMFYRRQEWQVWEMSAKILGFFLALFCSLWKYPNNRYKPVYDYP